jgi:hypothetical protein
MGARRLPPVAVLAWGLGQQQRLTQTVAEERAG